MGPIWLRYLVSLEFRSWTYTKSKLTFHVVGGTSGIGESTARAFIRNTTASRAYLIGRDQARASRIIEELRQIKPDSQAEFIKSDVSLLREVDEVCMDIKKKEDRLNLFFLSPGTGSMKGPDGMKARK